MAFFARLSELFGITPRPPAVPLIHVSSDWLQMPSLAPGQAFAIVGESHYQDALEAVAGGRNEAGTLRRLITAVIEAEPSNRYDRRAIRVVVEGRIVGHIPRNETALFHPLLQRVNPPCLVRGRLTGGWDRGPKDRGLIGVELLLDWPLAPMSNAIPFLPREKEVALCGEELCPPLGLALGVPFITTLRVAEMNPLKPEATGPFILALLGSQMLGWLTPTMTPRYLSLIQQLLAAGVQPTTTAIASEGKKCPQVRLLLPDAA